MLCINSFLSQDVGSRVLCNRCATFGIVGSVIKDAQAQMKTRLTDADRFRLNDVMAWWRWENIFVKNGHKEFFVVLNELWNQGCISYSEEGSDKEKSIEVQPLSGHEAWILFARIAFKEGHAPMELEDSVPDECKGFSLALNAVAATMKGKSCVDEWEISLSLTKPSDPSFPQTHAPVDQELYQRLKWSYDALPHPNVETRFFSSAMLMGDADMTWTN